MGKLAVMGHALQWGKLHIEILSHQHVWSPLAEAYTLGMLSNMSAFC